MLHIQIEDIHDSQLHIYVKQRMKLRKNSNSLTKHER
jgi:hypothetical protein